MPKLNKNVLKQANCSWNGPQKVAPKFFRHSVLELFYIPMWNILKMWATYSKALLENHMIFHLCVVAFHQFLVSSRECARTSKVVAVAPLLRNNWTKSYAQNLKPRQTSRGCSAVVFIHSQDLKIWKSWLFSIGITCLLSILTPLGFTVKWFWFPFLLWFCGLFGWKSSGKY